MKEFIFGSLLATLVMSGLYVSFNKGNSLQNCKDAVEVASAYNRTEDALFTVVESCQKEESCKQETISMISDKVAELRLIFNSLAEKCK